MPTATSARPENGHDPAGRVPAAVARPWNSPIIEYSAVDPVPIVLGGVERHLLYTNRALKAIQRETGKNPFDGQHWGDLMREPDGLAVVLRAGLLHESPDLTTEQVDDWVYLPRINYYVERLWYAWRDAMPDPEPAAATTGGEASDDPNAGTAPTG